MEDIENISQYLEQKLKDLKDGAQTHSNVHKDVEKALYWMLWQVSKDSILEIQHRISEDQKWASVKSEDYTNLIKHLYNNG